LSGFAQEHDDGKTGGRRVFRKMIERACDREHALARLLCSDRRFFRAASSRELLETVIAGSIPVRKAYQRHLIETVETDKDKVGVKNGKNVLERAASTGMVRR
jgi:hypothetical protein